MNHVHQVKRRRQGQCLVFDLGQGIRFHHEGRDRGMDEETLQLSQVCLSAAAVQH